MKKKLLAILSAAVMCLSAVPIAGTAVSAEENAGDILPDWVPESFSEALEFENTYGATHIEDGVVCLLFSETTNESYSYEISATTDVMTEVSRNTYTEDLADFKYEVVVYKPFANGSFEVDLNRKFQTATFVDYSFDFYVDEDGTISETDIYSWVPDCITEYNDFAEKNGTVSVHGGYIAYYYTVGGGTGNSLIMEQNGTAEIKQIAESDCTEKVAYTEVCGTPTYSVVVYQPVSDGTVDISWKIGYEWDLENSTISEINKSYEVSENGTNITDITTPVKGDVNNDSLFDASDVKLFQKWQVNAADTKLSNWRNADLNGDEKLDVFDSCLMRRELIEQNQVDAKPVLMIEDYQITMSENGWGSECYERVVTADGNRYSVPLCDCAYLSVEDHMNHIKQDGEKEQYITDTEVLQNISDFTESAAQYKDCEMENWNFGIDDWGQEILYALYTDENGSYQMIELCRFGGECAWLNNAEVQEFVTMLIENGYFGDKYIFNDYLENK